MTSLPQPVQAVVSLFEGPLSGVRFADIDAAGLSTLAAEVTQLQAQVEEHESKLQELKQNLGQKQESLLALAQQALAYAKIYAEGDETLSAQLSEISLPRAAKPRKAKATASETAEAEGSSPAPVAAATLPSTPAPEERVHETDGAEAPEETKPAYARPKLKRKLARAGAGSSP